MKDLKLKSTDRVKVGFTTGTVVKMECGHTGLEPTHALVQLDSGGLPHLVPVTSVRKLED